MGARADADGVLARPRGTPASASARSPVWCGTPAPDFTLEDQDGAPLRFANCHSRRPVVLAFYCSVSCVSCVVHLFHLRQLLRCRRNVTLLAIGSDGRAPARRLLALLASDHHGCDFVLLDDPTLVVTERYGLLECRGSLRPVPATFVIDRSGFVRCSLVDAAHHHRPSADVVRRALDAADGQSHA